MPIIILDQVVCFYEENTAARDIYDDSSCTDKIVRKVLPYEWAVNFKDCFDFCVPNFLRSADQISDILGNNYSKI